MGNPIGTILKNSLLNAYSFDEFKFFVNIKVLENWEFSDSPIFSIYLPDTITDIGYECFARTKLKSITLPASVKTMKGSIFSDTSTPMWAKVLGSVPASGCDAWTFNISGTYPIYVPDESIELYKSAKGWTNYTSRIKPLSEFTG